MLRITYFMGLPLTLLLLIMAAAPWSTQAESGVVGSSSSSPITETTETNQRSLQRRCRASRLRECEFDCNRDCDCRQGLVCFRRGTRDNIPGCTNRPRGNNYCIDPKKFPTKTLWSIGSDGLPPPSFVFPLRACWGSCVTDKDWYVVQTFRSTD
jgi:hypothetical protein